MVGIRNTIRILFAVTVWCGLVEASSEDVVANPDSRDRSTAVALNYCRASFHRIRTYPSTRVLFEEREKILNNLDLNGIADEEVIRLYSDVLDEICQVQLVDKDREVLRNRYKQTFRRQLTANAFIFGTQLAFGQYLSAIRTGANSWWDYRNMGWQRDLDVWAVDRKRMTNVVSKSSRFLDTFWKLTQKKNIPDRWLVRGEDLDKLEQATREPNPETRLRVLKRMERFMECYPPYWYYVARTQQELGQLFAAAKTYDLLADLATGHFRNDDMLAASLANLAAIQEYLKQPGAATTASEALRYSTDVWQANLVCAAILERHGELDRAEDAVLRNIDVHLEREQSLTALVGLYYRADDRDKLLTWLSIPAVIRDIPAPVLLQCAAKLGDEGIPEPLKTHLTTSIAARPDFRFGPDDFIITAAPGWRLNQATIATQVGARSWERPIFESTKDGLTIARFRGVLDVGNQLRAEPQAVRSALIDLRYPDLPPIRLVLQLKPVSNATDSTEYFNTGNYAGTLPMRSDGLQVTAFEMGDFTVVFNASGKQLLDAKARSADAASIVPSTINTPRPVQPQPQPKAVSDVEPTAAAPVTRPRDEAPPPPKLPSDDEDADALTIGSRPRAATSK